MNKIKLVILNPFVLGLFFAFVASYLLTPYFQKYKIEILKRSLHPNTQIYFHDINHDGFDERICLSYDRDNKSFPSIECRKMENLSDASTFLVKQTNLIKDWLAIPEPVFYDFDFDGQDEIFFLAITGDSLFLIGTRPWKSTKNPFIEKYICEITIQSGEPDVNFSKLFLHDLNGDHHNEITFTVLGGWSAEPRVIVSYDILNDSVTIAEFKYAGLKLSSIVDDSNSEPLLLCQSYAPGNTLDTTSSYYTDSCAWLFVFDKNLDPLFPPIKETRHKSSIIPITRIEDTVIYIYAAFNTINMKDSAFIRKYDTDGNLVAEVILEGRHYISDQSNLPGELFIHDVITNTNYELKPDLTFGNTCINMKLDFPLDLENDEIFEFINYDYNQYEFVIIPDDFSSPVRIQLPGDFNHWRSTDIKLSGSKANLLIQQAEHVYYCYYFKDPIYYLKYPAYLIIYLIISFFFYFLLREQKRRLLLKFEQEKRLNELEILTIKNQIDPHFTFNAINTLSALQYKNDKKLSHQFLVDMSALIRNTLNNSKKIEVRLSDEIEFVERYLKLQHIRFEGKFDFNIKIDNKIDQTILIPKMIIQTFTENAVKHGLMHKKEKGNLEISLTSTNNLLKIIIEDDGVGRAKAAQYRKHSTGKGHDIVKQIIRMYNKMYKTNVTFIIEDLADKNGNALGTKISVQIPIKI